MGRAVSAPSQQQSRFGGFGALIGINRCVADASRCRHHRPMVCRENRENDVKVLKKLIILSCRRCALPGAQESNALEA
jgi:hypothetical protein